jgi:polyhydroxyalkanoate synthesis repressor PhaR
MTLIKRYPNRKLYDTAARRYVTLAEIANLIQRGVEVQVVDYASGEDLTARILSQVIFEQEKSSRGFVPSPVLAGLAQAGGHTLAAMRRALLAPLGFARQVDEEIQRRMAIVIQQGDLDAAEGQRILEALLALSPLAIDLPAAIERSIERILAERDVPTREDLQRLQAQIEALDASLKS